MPDIETLSVATLTLFFGCIIGAWSARRRIVTQCRKLGGFYVGSTTIKVAEMKEPEYWVPGHTPQCPPRRPPTKPFSEGGIVDPNAGATVKESL